MVIANFQVENKIGRPRFFQKIFLIANTKFEMILRMLFLKISNADVSFVKEILTWKFYTTSKALPTIKQVELIDLNKFLLIGLDADSKTFVVHVANKKQGKLPVHSEKLTQIQNKAQVEALIFDKTSIVVLAKYSDYSNVFKTENVAELPEHTGINDHAIKLGEDQQPAFGPIYSLRPVELETLKTYIKTILANGFIQPFKSLTRAPILFDWKSDESLSLCVDYWGLNNITIQNRYLLSLIDESLDWLDKAKRFTQLDLMNVYHQMRICKNDEWKTVFRTHYSHFKYQVMFFGFFNALAIFQGYVNKILAKKFDISLIVYLDDILIYTINLSQPHFKVVYWVLS